MRPVLDMYGMLTRYLPDGYLDREEMDRISVLRSTWRKLVQRALEVTDELITLQHPLKNKLIADVKDFKKNIVD